jgi:hypothetical protein
MINQFVVAHSKEPDHRFERIYLDMPALEIPWKLLDPMQATHRFEGIFLKLC